MPPRTDVPGKCGSLGGLSKLVLDPELSLEQTEVKPQQVRCDHCHAVIDRAAIPHIMRQGSLHDDREAVVSCCVAGCPAAYHARCLEGTEFWNEDKFSNGTLLQSPDLKQP